MSTPSSAHRQFTVIVHYSADDGVYLASVPVLGIMTWSETQEHAFEMAKDAITGWIASAAKNNDPIPFEGDEAVEACKIAV